MARTITPPTGVAPALRPSVWGGDPLMPWMLPPNPYGTNETGPVWGDSVRGPYAGGTFGTNAVGTNQTGTLSTSETGPTWGDSVRGPYPGGTFGTNAIGMDETRRPPSDLPPNPYGTNETGSTWGRGTETPGGTKVGTTPTLTSPQQMPFDPPAKKGNPWDSKTGLARATDRDYITSEVNRGFQQRYGRDATPDELNYWMNKALTPDEYSDNNIRVGWNPYWYDRLATPGHEEASDPRLAGTEGIVGRGTGGPATRPMTMPTVMGSGIDQRLQGDPLARIRAALDQVGGRSSANLDALIAQLGGGR